VIDSSGLAWDCPNPVPQILTILILNAIVGVSQETRAEKAIAALQEYSATEAKAMRDGALHRIKAEDLVPGDIIFVAIGDRSPADCRLLSIHSNVFKVDQAILTGESESVGKDVEAILDSKAVIQDQTNMLFSGTVVTVGHATAIVVLTGASTAIGDIHESIVSQISEPTPLKQKLNDFGDMLAKVITVICILVWLINIQHFNDPSHGSWTKGAIYYLKVKYQHPGRLRARTYRLTLFRSRYRLELLPFQKGLLSSSPPASHSGHARWQRRMPWFGACLP
jgi:P-type Ca2+ transporter type 2A